MLERANYSIDQTAKILSDKLKSEFTADDILGLGIENRFNISIHLKQTVKAFDLYNTLSNKAEKGDQTAIKELEEIDNQPFQYIPENGESKNSVMFIIHKNLQNDLEFLNRFVRLHDEKGFGGIRTGRLINASENLHEILTGNKMPDIEHLERNELCVTNEDINWFVEAYKKCMQQKLIDEKTTKKQEPRVNQLHTLIRNVDIALTNDKISPTAQAVWNEIEGNHFEYDHQAIIQEVKDNTIYWKSKKGKEQSLPFTSFSSTLSAIRRKHKDN